MKQRSIVAGIFIALLCGAIYYLYIQAGSVTQAVTRCKYAKDATLCLTNEINNVLERRGIAEAFDLLAAAYEVNPDFAQECHGNTHELGQAAYRQFHENKTLELSPKASYCGFGFYHGFIEALIAQTRDLSEAREFCRYAGEVVPIPLGYAEGACYHGIGHGVVDGSDPRVWGNAQALVAPGLALCRKVALTSEWRYRCATGAFNSVALMYRDPRYKLDATGDPYRLCRTGSFDELEKKSCYSQMDTATSFVSGSFAEAMGYASAVDRLYREEAIRGVSSISIQRLKSQPSALLSKEVSTVCGSLLEPERTFCINGLIDGIMEHGSPEKQYLDGLKLCSADLGTLVEPCYRRLAQNIETLYSGGTLAEACAALPTQFRPTVCNL